MRCLSIPSCHETCLLVVSFCVPKDLHVLLGEEENSDMYSMTLLSFLNTEKIITMAYNGPPPLFFAVIILFIMNMYCLVEKVKV